MQLAVANFNHLRFLDNPCQREHFAIGQGVATESRDISKGLTLSFRPKGEIFFLYALKE